MKCTQIGILSEQCQCPNNVEGEKITSKIKKLHVKIMYKNRTIQLTKNDEALRLLPPTHPDTICENNTLTALKGCAVKIIYIF